MTGFPPVLMIVFPPQKGGFFSQIVNYNLLRTLLIIYPNVFIISYKYKCSFHITLQSNLSSTFTTKIMKKLNEKVAKHFLTHRFQSDSEDFFNDCWKSRKNIRKKNGSFRNPFDLWSSSGHICIDKKQKM